MAGGRPPKLKSEYFTCPKCNVNKHNSLFYKDSRAKSGFQVNCKDCQKKYYIENKEHFTQLKRQPKYKDKVSIYQKKNSEKINKYNRERYSTEDGKAKVKALNIKRKAIKRTTSDGSVTSGFILGLLKKQEYKCALSGKCIKDNYHIDHIIPISKGGTHTSDNIQLLCPEVNLAKSNKLDYKY